MLEYTCIEMHIHDNFIFLNGVDCLLLAIAR